MKKKKDKSKEEAPPREERLQKFISMAGVCSRRKAEELIAEGLVTVNGEVVTKPHRRIDPERDTVKVEGKRVRPAEKRVYILLYKPRGVLSTLDDPEGRKTIRDLVPVRERIYPVGRLDFQSEGLMILSNDGRFMEKITGPRNKVVKVYQVKVRGIPEIRDLEKLTEGMRIDGKLHTVLKATILERKRNAWLEISLREGKKRQLRKMLERIRHPVVKLKRTRIGPYTLRGLKPGEWRRLGTAEVEKILQRR